MLRLLNDDAAASIKAISECHLVKSSKELPSTTPDRGEPPEGSSAVLAWQVLRKYWPTALGSALVVVLAAVFYTLGQTKIYQAQATVHFDPNPPRPLGHRVESVVDMGAGNYWGNQEYYETQYKIIQSRRVAVEVVRELGLHTSPPFLQNLPAGAEPESKDTTTPELAAELLRGRLKVAPVRDSRLAVVTYEDANPERAQRVLSVLVDTYIAQNLERALESTGAATDWLRQQLDGLKEDLEQSELELHKYKKKKDILSIAFDEKSNMLAHQISQISSELTRVRAALQEAAARRAVIAGTPSNDPTQIQSTELLNSPLLNTLRADYQRAVRERDALLGAKKGPNHPQVAAAQRRVDAAEAAILKEIENVKRAVDRDVAVLSRQAGGLQGMYDEAKHKAQDLNLLEIEYNRLRRSKENTEKLYAMVLERTKEADLTQMLRVNNISLVDRPMVPRTPIKPRVPLNIALGGLLGLIVGLAAAFARALFDRTVKVPDDIEREFGITFLGLLPQFAASGLPPAKRRRWRGKRPVDGPAELIVHEEPTSSLAEAARSIRTNLMFMAADDPHKTLLVTSGGPSEGKTTVACCIAIAMAQAGQRVVLVDCDLRRPRIHRIFGADSTVGVTTAILHEGIQEAIQETVVPSLHVVPSGPIPPNPAELLHTDRFKTFLTELQKRFDRVIIDSPPVGAVTDATILSTLVDSTVLVVRAFQARKETVRHAVRTVVDVGGDLAGAVLNAVDFSKHEYKYSYQYYRRNEYYTAADEGEGRLSAVPVSRDEAQPPG